MTKFILVTLALLGLSLGQDSSPEKKGPPLGDCGPNGCNSSGPGDPPGINPSGFLCSPSGCNLGNGQQNLNVGNPDFGRIEQPCPKVDIACIRKYFHEHGHCQIVKDSIANPYLRKNKVIHYLPSINVTLTFPPKAEVKGLADGLIQDFYINKDTDKAVLVIYYEKLEIFSKKSYVRFNRRGKEPVVTADYTKVDVDGLTVTSIIPQINDLDVERMVIYPFIDKVKLFTFGPKAFKSDDKQVLVTPLALALNIEAVYQEFFMSEALIYNVVFIQKQICNFDVPFFI